ncbi:serine/arginine repetitive matrix protein 1-like [Penaeus chinensis]|uniref:serine/arginine repetitive matrix protein 1-like n=1 Tax=Penaeus chinensis TaxID=139456 RepID=UPI001FB5B31B|nr:serine/arginine repetitive matrix protein 1-like [Penaeus chinensis]XP_047492535.1 serine/arginine repetitive matrix protein 1-like [Penaeus chinensis]
MASWLLTANLESAKPQVMPPPSAFAFPYGQGEEFEGVESPADSGASGFGLSSDRVGGNMVYNAFNPTQPKMKSKNIEKKKGTLHKRRKQINKILKTMQDQQKRKTLLQERQTIVRELKRLTELEFTIPQVPPHSPPIDSASACSDHSHKENKMKGSDTSNTQPVTDPTSNAQSTTGNAKPCKVKSKRSLRKRRREVYELLNNSLLTKKRKAELEQELVDINSVLKKPRKTVFDELDFQYAEQLFGNDEEEQNHDVDQYIPNPEENVEPVHDNNIFEFKRTSKQTAMRKKSPDAFPQRENQEANGTHLEEAYKESFRDYFNGNPAYADHYDNSFDKEQPHGSHEEHFEPRLNPGSHFINEVLADDCRRHLERIGVMISDTDGQISLMPRQHQRERSPDLPLREGSPGLPNRERPPDFYREESPTHSYREGSSDYPYRERSPALSYRGRSPCSYREGSPCPSYRERSPDPSYQEGLPPPFYRERSPYHADREVSPGPSYEEREMSPYPACRERVPDLSYRSTSDRGSHSRDGSQEPAPTSRFRRYSGHMADAHENFQDDYSPGMEDHSPFRDHGGPDRYMSEDQRKEEEQREEDLRIHLLRLREQKVERRLKVLEQETKETENRLRRLQERRLSEELDDFLREQSKYWKKEDMETERDDFSPQHGNERTRHGHRNHQIYF